jgi:RHS repeat-associated protein
MKILKSSALFLYLVLTVSVPHLLGQVGNDNLTGPAGTSDSGISTTGGKEDGTGPADASGGIGLTVGAGNIPGAAEPFNGSVTTGCYYNPYTANAVRTITDMVVAGAVGKYGLSFSRTWNTRTAGWQYSYNWAIEVSGVPGQYETYYVTFPDGRQETFNHVATDVYYRATSGIRERLQRWTATNGNIGSCYLVLPDGGKIEFSGTRTTEFCSDCHPPAWYEYNLTATAMIDPYGQRTTYATNADGSFQISEQAGRWIKVYYAAGHIDYIQSSDGREVHYTWQTQYYGIPSLPYSVLTSVLYYNDPSLTATYTYSTGNLRSGVGLATCDDPMYPGPMKKIAYGYKASQNADGSWPVAGQIEREKSGTTGEVVTTLAVTGASTRRETRADGRQRTFTYAANGYLIGWTDFKNIPSSQTYDSNKYVDSVTDGRGNTTNFTNNPLTGAVTQIQYPATPNDTTPPSQSRGTVTYTYGWAGCPDPNNTDDYNPYYLYSVTDEGGHDTIFTRDNNKRITRIDYPDGGHETFSYNGFGQVLTHELKTGGVESFTYDTRGLRQTYRSPDNTSGDPTARYGYDGLDRVSGTTDVFGFYAGDPYHSTIYQYNSRGQLTVTTLPNNPVDGLHHTIVNSYNPNGDGTLVSVTDQLGHVTSYTYDDYRRRRSMTTPLRSAGDSTARTTWLSYDRNQGTGDDYTHTDSNVTRITLPSENIGKTVYDENYRKISVTASYGSGADAATTSYGYDEAGNLTTILMPDEQEGQVNHGKSTVSAYDERNRLRSVKDALDHFTTYTFDAGGRKKTVTQPNGQIITYDEYDSMQQTVKQTAQMDAVTKYTYQAGTGLHMTMQDPHLVQIASSYVYTFEYDQMGRPKSLTYPPGPGDAPLRTELRSYDEAGRLRTHTNRDGKAQTFHYDNLHRQTGFTWSAGASTPNVSLGYDPANRVTSITSSGATISRTYFDDNLLHTETETPTGGVANIVTYTWNPDANRESILYPSGNKYRFNYTGRDQLKHVQDNNSFIYQAEYAYDVNGNMATRKVGNNLAVVTDASQRDALGRCTHLEHQLTSVMPKFDYVYDEMGNRTSIQRDGGTTEIYGYDFAQQVTAGVDGGTAHTYDYDANGNRTALDGGGSYDTNNLNQQTTFAGQPVGYDTNGNVSTSWGGGSATYIYDAQNRLTSVTNNGTTTTFSYDGLNRRISQTVGGVTTFNVWDGWNLIEERSSNNALLNTYVYGAGGIIERIAGATAYFYYQDGLGSTSHISDASGTLQEAYRYGTFGQLTVYAPNGSVRENGSIYDIRHLYAGQLWMPQAGLYDSRYRAYSPSLTRFLQPDPIGFLGDRTNLYRYCGNNAVNRRDPFGLDDSRIPKQYQNAESDADITVEVTATRIDGTREVNGLDRGGVAGEGGHGDGGGGRNGGASPGPSTPTPTIPPTPSPSATSSPFFELLRETYDDPIYRLPPLYDATMPNGYNLFPVPSPGYPLRPSPVPNPTTEPQFKF